MSEREDAFGRGEDASRLRGNLSGDGGGDGYSPDGWGGDGDGYSSDYSDDDTSYGDGDDHYGNGLGDGDGEGSGEAFDEDGYASELAPWLERVLA